MTIDDKITDEKQQDKINRKALKNQHYQKIKLINMNIVQVKKYYLLMKVE